jgi:hypothetical protein
MWKFVNWSLGTVKRIFLEKRGRTPLERLSGLQAAFDSSFYIISTKTFYMHVVYAFFQTHVSGLCCPFCFSQNIVPSGWNSSERHVSLDVPPGTSLREVSKVPNTFLKYRSQGCSSNRVHSNICQFRLTYIKRPNPLSLDLSSNITESISDRDYRTQVSSRTFTLAISTFFDTHTHTFSL